MVKINIMKRQFLLVAAFFLTLIIHGQKSAIDQMFDKYAEKDGFTVVTISGRMFNLLGNMESENKDADNIISKLSSIQILTVEDSLLNKNLNFYSELNKKLDLLVYEELMVVKEGKDMTKFLVRQKGDRISELLVITGGPSANSIISIKGEFNLKNISDLSRSMDIKELQGLEKMDKNEKKD